MSGCLGLEMQREENCEYESIEGASDDEKMLCDEPDPSSAIVPPVVPRRRKKKGKKKMKRRTKRSISKKGVYGKKRTTTKRRTRTKKIGSRGARGRVSRAYREPEIRLSVLGEGIEPPMSTDEPLVSTNVALKQKRSQSPRRKDETDSNDLLGSILVHQTETLAHGRFFSIRNGQMKPKEEFVRYAGRVMQKMSGQLKEQIGPLKFGNVSSRSSCSTSESISTQHSISFPRKGVFPSDLSMRGRSKVNGIKTNTTTRTHDEPRLGGFSEESVGASSVNVSSISSTYEIVRSGHGLPTGIREKNSQLQSASFPERIVGPPITIPQESTNSVETAPSAVSTPSVFDAPTWDMVRSMRRIPKKIVLG